MQGVMAKKMIWPLSDEMDPPLEASSYEHFLSAIATSKKVFTGGRTAAYCTNTKAVVIAGALTCFSLQIF